jgi:hypothetical protein
MLTKDAQVVFFAIAKIGEPTGRNELIFVTTYIPQVRDGQFWIFRTFGVQKSCDLKHAN